MNDNNSENKEEEKKGGQDTAEKATEAKDTADMAKEGVDLAKNVSTGNAIGIAKNAFNLLKNKQFRKRLLMQLLIPVISLILAGALVLGLFESVGNVLLGIVKGIGEFVGTIIEVIIDAITIKTDGAIDISDEKIDEIINAISAEGISVEDLKITGEIDYDHPEKVEENQEALRKFIKNFYEADQLSKVINANPDLLQENKVNNDEDLMYGNVYLYRDIQEVNVLDGADSNRNINNNNKVQLTFIPYNSDRNLTGFKEILNTYDGTQYIGFNEIQPYLKNFSINDEGMLCYFTYGSDGDHENYYLKEEQVDYLSLISKYTTDMDFFIYLTMVSQNPEFASKIADLVKKHTRIEMVILDNVQEYTLAEAEDGVTMTNEDEYKEAIKNKQIKSSNVKYLEVNSQLVITGARTFFCNFGIGEDGYTRYKYPGEVIYAGNKRYDFSSRVAYKLSQTIGTGNDDYKIGSVGSKGVNDQGEVDDDTTFIGLMDDVFDIPNTTRDEAAGSNLVSAAEMLFELLRKNQRTEGLEQTMRYIMNKYNDTKKYGDIKYEDIAKPDNEIKSTEDFYVNNEALFIKDAETLKKAIANLPINEDGKTNLTDNIQSFLDMQDKYKVNAAFAIAVTITESGARNRLGCYRSKYI